MALEITSIGASVKYCIESTAGTRPTTGYTTLPDITKAPDVSLAASSIEVSNITDTTKRYAPGQQDPGDKKTFTVNHTEAFLTAWSALVTAANTAYATGKATWFEYAFPNATNSFFWSGIPQRLGTDGIDTNSAHTLSADVVLTDIGDWAAKSTTI